MQSHGEFQKHTNGAGLLDLKTGLKKLPLKIGISVTCWFYMFVIHILKWIVLHNLRWVYLRGWSAEMEVVILDNHLNSIFFYVAIFGRLVGTIPFQTFNCESDSTIQYIFLYSRYYRDNFRFFRLSSVFLSSFVQICQIFGLSWSKIRKMNHNKNNQVNGQQENKQLLPDLSFYVFWSAEWLFLTKQIIYRVIEMEQINNSWIIDNYQRSSHLFPNLLPPANI